MYAAREGSLEAARALVELGAQINLVALPATDVVLTDEVRHASETTGTTALVYAIINVHYDLAAMLLEKGANPNIVDTSRDGGAVRRRRDEHAPVGPEPARPDPEGRLDGAAIVKRLLAARRRPERETQVGAAQDLSSTRAHTLTSAGARRRSCVRRDQ